MDTELQNGVLQISFSCVLPAITVWFAYYFLCSLAHYSMPFSLLKKIQHDWLFFKLLLIRSAILREISRDFNWGRVDKQEEGTL